MTPKTRLRLGLALLALLLLGLRVFDLGADPPVKLDWSGGIFFDEGMLVQGARNRLLFGDFFQDEWNDLYISPLLSLFKLAVLSLTGVGLVQVRLIPVFFSLLSLGVFYLIFRRGTGAGTALLAAALLGCNHVFVMFNRIGLTETPVVFFMLLAGLLWQEGLLRLRAGLAGEPGGGRPAWWLFFAGASAFAAYTVKSFPYFIPALLFASFLAWWLLPEPARALRLPAARRALGRAAAALLGGLALPAAAWYVLFYRPFAPSILQAMHYYSLQQVPGTATAALKNLRQLPFFNYFSVTPVELLFSLLFAGAVFHLWFSNRRRLLPIDLFFLVWFLAHFAMFAVLNYRPVRYYLPIVPPMVALAVRGMLLAGRRAAVQVPRRIHPGAFPLLFLWLFVVLLYGVPVLAGSLEELIGRPIRHLPAAAAPLAAGVAALLALAAAALAARRWGGVLIPLAPRATTALIVALPLMAAFAGDAWSYGRWALSRRHVIRDASRELGSTLETAYIAGLGAATVCLENRHRAIHVYQNFFNWRDTFARFPITHLFMGGFNREVDFYYRLYPERMSSALVTRVFPIKQGHFYLYSLVDPSVEGVSAPGEGETAFRVRVRNNDRERSRAVTAGGIFLPVDGRGEPIVRQAGPLEVGPAATAEVPLSGDLPPGAYRLLARATPDREHVFEAENLAHRGGHLARPDRASNGEAWETREAGYPVFGPYLRYDTGLLRVAFRVRLEESAPAGAVATVSVTTDRGRTVLASRDLDAADFATPGAWEEFVLPPVALEEPRTLEFPVRAAGGAALTIDRVTAVFTPGTWLAATVRSSARKPGTVSPSNASTETR